MTRNRILGIALASATLVISCTGDQGDTGPAGPTGPQGDPGEPGVQGDPGPLVEPPYIASVSPDWGSAMTQVTLAGNHFSTTAADNRVMFNGVEAHVISATATELVVAPAFATEDPWPVVISVEVANQVSNAVAFTLVPSGYARSMELDLPTAPTAVVALGGDLYLAAGGWFSPSSGLYVVDGDGWATREWAPRALEITDSNGATTVIYDSPVALTSDGIDVFFTTLLGSVKRYDVSTGTLSEVLAPFGGGDNCDFPARTGLVFDSAGYLYVVDRSVDTCAGGVIRLAPNGTLGLIQDPAFGSAGVGTTLYGIASNGSALFLSDAANNGVIRVDNPQTASPTVTDAWASSTFGIAPRAITRLGSNVLVAAEDGTLWSAPVASGGTLAPWGDAGGYGYRADGMWSATNGDLYLAQPDSSAVRRIATGSTDAEIVSAGMRLAFGTTRIGNTWYLATLGIGLFGGGLGTAAAAPDGAILEVSPDNTSRVLLGASFPIGIVATSAGDLTVSDCLDARIFTLDPSAGTTADLLDTADGLTCPGGLHYADDGDLFYLNTNLTGGTPSTIGRLANDDTNTLAFATGLPPGMFFLAAIDDDLFVSSVGAGSGDGPGVAPIFHASATSGGAADQLVPASVAGPVMALGASPLGALYFMRFGWGEILEVNPLNGEVYPFGIALAGPVPPGAAGGGVGSFSIGFEPDGTFVIADFGQGQLIYVAP